jgi:hypothetical protein
MTWLHVPNLPPPSTSAPASDCLSSSRDSPGSTPKLWLTLSGTATQRPLFWPAWRKRPWTRRLFGTISAPSTAQRGADAWISSLPVSPANHSALPASNEVSMTSDGSGQTLPGSSLTWDRATCSWRTSPDLFGTVSHTSSPTLPTSGAMRNGVVSQRPPLAPLTDGTGYGSGQPWATPTATDQLSGGPSDIAPRGNRSDITLRGQAKMWPTPKASEGFRVTDPARPGRTGGDSLIQAVAGWPTPKARDAKGPENANHNSPSLETFAQLGHPDETTPTDGPTGPPEADLNPSFVEALMGLPDKLVRPRGHGERLHALGNGLVPQAGASALRQLIARSQR